MTAGSLVQASAKDPAPIALGGTTVITGSTSAYVPVSIDRKASLSRTILPRSDSGPTKDISIAGDGRLVGIVVVPDPPPDGLSTEDFVIAGRFARCPEPGCAPGDRAINFQFPGKYVKGRPVTLSPGQYRLYLLADGKPVRVVLRLHGLSGTKSLRPRLPAPADLRTPPKTLVSDSASPYFAAGDTYKAGLRGIFLTALWARSSPAQDFVYGFCHHANLSPLPPEVVYGPQCEALAAAGGGVTAFGYFGDERGFNVTLLADYTESPAPESPDGTAGLGAWISATGPLDHTGSQGMFLRWDE
ncbi:MAG: hypothetical protein ACRDLB_13140 [Actinomycetota bacterium]